MRCTPLAAGLITEPDGDALCERLNTDNNGRVSLSEWIDNAHSCGWLSGE